MEDLLPDKKRKEQAEIDKVFEDFQESTNMSLGQLKKWEKDPRSKLASESRTGVKWIQIQNLSKMKYSKDS